MGGSDTYCALCGVDLYPYWDEDTEEPVLEPGESPGDYDIPQYDPRLVKRKDAAWTEDTRVMGENLALSRADNVFISGPCTDTTDGVWSAPSGDDPNAPAPRSGREDLWSFFYNGETEYSTVFPFHYACYNIVFRDMVKHHTAVDEIDNGVLYETMKAFSPASDPIIHKLETLDYGEASNYQDQYWVSERGAEALVVFPGPCQAITDVYNKLLRSEDSVQLKWTQQGSAVGDAGYFSSLPIEIVFNIMTDLPLDAIFNLRACSKQLHTVVSNDGYWKRKLKLNMPWTYDMPESIWEQGIDWARSYRMLDLGTLKYNEKPFLGLANRRRIWKICEPIVEGYLTRLRAKQEDSQGAEGAEDADH